MIRRRLNESSNTEIKKICESWKRTDSPKKHEVERVYDLLFEDVISVGTVWVHPDAQSGCEQFENGDYWSEFFNKVEFADGTHYFAKDYSTGKLELVEVDFTPRMKEEAEVESEVF